MPDPESIGNTSSSKSPRTATCLSFCLAETATQFDDYLKLLTRCSVLSTLRPDDIRTTTRERLQESQQRLRDQLNAAYIPPTSYIQSVSLSPRKRSDLRVRIAFAMHCEAKPTMVSVWYEELLHWSSMAIIYIDLEHAAKKFMPIMQSQQYAETERQPYIKRQLETLLTTLENPVSWTNLTKLPNRKAKPIILIRMRRAIGAASSLNGGFEFGDLTLAQHRCLKSIEDLRATRKGSILFTDGSDRDVLHITAHLRQVVQASRHRYDNRDERPFWLVKPMSSLTKEMRRETLKRAAHGLVLTVLDPMIDCMDLLSICSNHNRVMFICRWEFHARI